MRRFIRAFNLRHVALVVLQDSVLRQFEVCRWPANGGPETVAKYPYAAEDRLAADFAKGCALIEARRIWAAEKASRTPLAEVR